MQRWLFSLFARMLHHRRFVSCILFSVVTYIVQLCSSVTVNICAWPHVGPGQSPLIPSLPHLLYLLVSFPFFPFLIYASSIFFVFLKMMWCLKMWRMMYVRYLRLRRTFPWQWTVWTLSSILNSLCRLLSAEFSFLAIFVKHLCFD